MIHALFPTPVWVVDNPDQSLSGHSELLNSEYETSIGSFDQFQSSRSSYILDDHAPALRTWIESQISEFARSGLATTKPLKITQSWCVLHEDTEQKVFLHDHPNSFISGAYYVDAPEGTQGLTIHRPSANPNHPTIRWEEDPELIVQQPWRWEWVDFPVKTGRLILFPSWIKHEVNGPLVKGRRCVLSFNTWFSGAFGDEDRYCRMGYIS